MAIFNRPLRAVAGGLLAPDPPVMGALWLMTTAAWLAAMDRRPSKELWEPSSIVCVCKWGINSLMRISS